MLQNSYMLDPVVQQLASSGDIIATSHTTHLLIRHFSHYCHYRAVATTSQLASFPGSTSLLQRAKKTRKYSLGTRLVPVTMTHTFMWQRMLISLAAQNTFTHAVVFFFTSVITLIAPQ